MKKQSKKLNLSKKTISNLDSSQMNEKRGGIKPMQSPVTAPAGHKKAVHATIAGPFEIEVLHLIWMSTDKSMLKLRL
jgi:hypothetical protein